MQSQRRTGWGKFNAYDGLGVILCTELFTVVLHSSTICQVCKNVKKRIIERHDKSKILYELISTWSVQVKGVLPPLTPGN